jgi:hypothetical protein
MAINPNIALSVKGIELQDPLVQYGRVSAIQQAQQQNQLAQMQMQQSQRDLAATNALNQAYKQAYNADTGEVDLNALRSSLATGGYGSKLPGIEKSIFEGREAKTKALKGETDLLDSKLKQSRQFLDTINPNSPDALQRYLQWNEGQFADPVIGKALQARGITIDQVRDQLSGLVSQPGGLQRAILQSAMGIEKFMELNKPSTQVIDRSGQRDVIQIPGLGGDPTTVGTYADVPLPEDVVEQKTRIARAGAPTITNVQERAELAARGQMLVDAFKDINNSAKVAARTLPALEANLATLDKGFKTGFGTEAQTAAASVLAALGVEKAKDFATNSQTFLANASQAVLQRQLEQKGPQTEADAQRITQTGAQLGNTPEANRFLLDVAREQLKRDVEQRDFYSRWFTKNKTYDGAEDAWFTGEGSKSLFERPALKKYTSPSQTPSAPGKPSLDSIFKGKKP